MAEVYDLSCLPQLFVFKSKLLHDSRSIHDVVPTFSHLQKQYKGTATQEI